MVKKPAPPSAPSTESRYPAVEGFVERASPADVDALFASLRQELEQLKGPRAEQGKRIARAVERCQELLKLLLETRAKLASPQAPRKR